MADRIRETLRARGYKLDDERAEWSHADGRSGKFPAPEAAAAAVANGPCLVDADILSLVTQRETGPPPRRLPPWDACLPPACPAACLPGMLASH